MTPTHRPSSDLGVHLDALHDSLRGETALVIALREALVAQRAAIAAHRADAVQATIADIGRVLQGLTDARRARGQLLHTLCGDAALPLDDLEATLGLPFPASLRAVRGDLRREAEAVAREVAINHRVLRGAVEAGDRFLQELFSSWGDSTPTYSAGAAADDAARPTSVFVNKVA